MNRRRLVLSQSAEEENDLFGNSYLSSTQVTTTKYSRNDSVAKSVRLNEQSSHTPTSLRTTLTWKNISAHLEQPGSSSRQLLDNVSGIARPAELLAIMGASGAGKTTLLNIMGGRSVSSSSITVNGSVKINGRPMTLDTVFRSVGFVHQEDIFPTLLTVREYLWFHAKLRMVKHSQTDARRRNRVEALLMELNLGACADTLIGNQEKGEKTLSGGERKRLSLATELIVNPSLLFLDEPTSGLDSFLAETVVLALRSLAKQAGKTVVFTVHQPSSQLYSYFDRLLLLAEGQVCFQGSTGDASRFFAAPPISQPCPLEFNPSDFYMDVICRGFQDRQQVIVDAYRSSYYAEMVSAEIETNEMRSTFAQNTDTASETDISGGNPKKAAIKTQLQLGIWRAAKVYYRSPLWIKTRIIETFTYPIIIGLCFFGLGLDPVGVANRGGMALQLTSNAAWDNIDQYTENLPLERGFLLRECAAGLYDPWVYFLSRQVIELPFMFVLNLLATTILFILPSLWMTTGFWGYIIAVGTCYLVALAASSVAYIFGCLTENFHVIATVCRPVLVAMFLCGGFYINVESIPPYFKWVPYISLFFYGNENVYIAEFGNITLPACSGYDPTDDSVAAKEIRCYNNGAEVLEYYNFNADHLGRNFGCLIALIVGARLIALFVLTYRTRRAITPTTGGNSCLFPFR